MPFCYLKNPSVISLIHKYVCMYNWIVWFNDGYQVCFTADDETITDVNNVSTVWEHITNSLTVYID